MNWIHGRAASSSGWDSRRETPPVLPQCSRPHFEDSGSAALRRRLAWGSLPTGTWNGRPDASNQSDGPVRHILRRLRDGVDYVRKLG